MVERKKKKGKNPVWNSTLGKKVTRKESKSPQNTAFANNGKRELQKDSIVVFIESRGAGGMNRKVSIATCSKSLAATHHTADNE